MIGTLKWAKVIENQIENQNKVALSYFANRTRNVVQSDNGITLRRFIIRAKHTAANAIKKSDISRKHDLSDKLEEVSKVSLCIVTFILK